MGAFICPADKEAEVVGHGTPLLDGNLRKQPVTTNTLKLLTAT
jgi:hypothetical protein